MGVSFHFICKNTWLVSELEGHISFCQNFVVTASLPFGSEHRCGGFSTPEVLILAVSSKTILGFQLFLLNISTLAINCLVFKSFYFLFIASSTSELCRCHGSLFFLWRQLHIILKVSSVPSIAPLIMNLFIIIKVIAKACHPFIFKREEPYNLLQVVCVGDCIFVVKFLDSRRSYQMVLILITTNISILHSIFSMEDNIDHRHMKVMRVDYNQCLHTIHTFCYAE